MLVNAAGLVSVQQDVDVLLALLLIPIAFGDAVVVERGSPGLVPSMKFSYINSYGSDLSYQRTLAAVPLAQTPGAIAFSPVGDIYLVEGPRIIRYQQSGSAMPFGEPFTDSIESIAFTATGDVLVAFNVTGFPTAPRIDFARLDANGRMIENIDLPEVIGVFGFDVDHDGCTVVFSGPRMLAMTNLCSSSREVKPLPRRPSGDFFGVRFLPSGNILVGSRGVVYELERDGATVRVFTTDAENFGHVVIDPDGSSFWTTSNNRVFRFSLATGSLLAGPVWLRNAAYGARSMAVRGEWRAAMHPIPRRRAVAS